MVLYTYASSIINTLIDPVKDNKFIKPEELLCSKK